MGELERICCVEGCDTPHSNITKYKSGDNNFYCNKHYLQIKRYGKILSKTQLRSSENEKCCVDNCERMDKKGGVIEGKHYCGMHYCQVKKHGNILERTKYNPNEIVLYDDYAEIILYNKNCEEVGRTIVDIEDVEKVKNMKWHKSRSGYAYSDSLGYRVRMHRFVLTVTDSQIKVDHKSRNKLDNRKDNIRICSDTENCQNKSLPSNNTSGIIGVNLNKRHNTWNAEIIYNKEKLRWYGFDDFEIAVKVRLLAEKKYFKEFAPQKQLYDLYNCNDTTLDEYLKDVRKIIGVSYDKTRDKWVAYLKTNVLYRKRFKSKEDAIKYRLQLEADLLGDKAPQKYLFAEYGILIKE